MINALLWWIAKTICPEMNGEAERWRFIHCEMLHQLRWLGEFQEIHDLIRRTLHMTHDHFRAIDAPAMTEIFWVDISHFREHLRKQRNGCVVPSPGWQPIETAPKDGTMILVYEKGAVSSKFWDHGYSDFVHEFPAIPGDSHWMPLPPPPYDKKAIK